jgi:hypothetical protein
MMMKMNKTKILIWIIVVLVAINLAALISGLAYSKTKKDEPTVQTEVPFNKRADFFYEQLGLTSDQREQFIVFNQEFNQNARLITDEMSSLRNMMIKEMSRSNPDTSKLDEICTDIGALHSQLKVATVDYYLKMKGSCDKDQQKSLSELFSRMINSDGSLEQTRPRYGRRNDGMGRGRQNRN